MKTTCKDVRDLLAAEGPEFSRGDVASHLAGCAGCAAFVESLRALEDGLGALPSHDAPDDAVRRLLARPELSREAAGAGAAGWAARLRALFADVLRPRPMLWSGVAAASLILVATVVLWPEAPAPELVLVSKYAPATTEGEEVGDRKAARNLTELDGQSGFVEAPSAVGRVGGDDLRGKEKAAPSGGQRVLPTPPPPPPPLATTAPMKNVPTESREEEPPAASPAPGRSHRGVLTLAPGVQDAGEAGVSEKVLPGAATGKTQAPLGDDEKAEPRDRDFSAEVSGVSNVDALADDRAAARPDEGSVSRRRLGTKMAGAAEQEAIRSEAAQVEEEQRKRDEWSRRQSRGSADENEVAAGEKKAVLEAPLIAGVGGVTTPEIVESSRVGPDYPEGADAAAVSARVVLSVHVAADGTVADATVLTCDAPDLGFEAAAVEAVLRWRYEPARNAKGDAVAVRITETVEFHPDEPKDDERSRLGRVDPDFDLARTFLDDREQIDGLRFRAAGGYWANTYLPGDPRMRWIASRLAAEGALPAGLHDASRPAAQPFDAPDDAAIDLFLHADRAGVEGPGRVLVQVGLQGTPGHAGRRPAMNVAIVLDLRGGVPHDTAIAMRALVRAFHGARETGDRFRLLATGADGVVVPADSFRHGVLEVTLDRLLAEKAPASNPQGLARTVATAFTDLAGGDDPASPLGATAVVLVTGAPLGAETATLADLAHQGAVAGIPTTVVGIGGGVDLDQIDRVALAGQGNRRLLERPAEAAALVDRELAAVGRAVARAVRLRIRLAPGVRLVGVIGSHRLDEVAAARVREAERSIDLRLASRLGIEADRGDDEEGIQIVIPTFYAGDAHAVLLDVVVPGPGPVAEATVRFKDLARLDNGTVRAGLALAEGRAPAGPLENNVLKNLLSHRLARTLEDAAEAARAGDRARAARMLDRQAALLAGVERIVPGLAGDADLARDLDMLAAYRSAVRSGAGLAPLSDSLLVAAHRKLQPRTLEIPS